MKKGGSVKKGTGRKELFFNMAERKVHINYSGNEISIDGQADCYRNDASVLFSLANSYWYATLAIEEKIHNCFDLNKTKTISKLIVPYLFNYRHFVELSIKALYMSVSGKQAEISHDICSLYKDLENVLPNLERDDREGIFAISNEVYMDAKSKIEEYIGQIDKLLIPYFSNEPAVEYYRFLFDNKNNLDFPEIDFDFNAQRKMQSAYHKTYKKLIREIHRIHYIYDMD